MSQFTFKELPAQLIQVPLGFAKGIANVGEDLLRKARRMKPEETFKESFQQQAQQFNKQSPIDLALNFSPMGIEDKTAKSVISYINKAGEKVFTKLNSGELEVLRNEVKNIPRAFKGVNQIHLDAFTGQLQKLGKEISREEFIAGHPQAKMVFGNAERGLRYIKDTTGKFMGSKPFLKTR